MNFLKLLVAIKSEKISLPAVIAMSIVRDGCKDDMPSMFIGETHAWFHSYAVALGYDTGKWGYSAVGRMLFVLHLRGYLTKDKYAQYVRYGISAEGRALLSRLEASATVSKSNVVEMFNQSKVG